MREQRRQGARRSDRHGQGITAASNGGDLFAPAPTSPEDAGESPGDVAVGDFDGDGDLDLAVANAGSNNVTVLLGDGTGNFSEAPGSPVAVGDRPSGLAVADFNGDGDLDLAVANAGFIEGDVTVLLGDGTGDFSEAPTSPAPWAENVRKGLWRPGDGPRDPWYRRAIVRSDRTPQPQPPR